MTEYMKKYGLRIFRNGYEVIPILPGQKFPVTAEKINGEEINKDWRSLEITETLVKKWQANGRGHFGVGIRTGKVILLDIDAPTKAIADEIELEVSLLVGEGLARYGAWPKRGLMFRTEHPFRKISTREFYPPGKTGKKHKHQVEALGDGQQFVSHHTHPDTKRPYIWITGSPLTVSADDLPIITEDEVRKIVECAEAVFARHGLEPAARSDQTVASLNRPSEIDEDDLLEGAPLRDVDDDKLRKLVMSIPNEGQDVPYQSDGNPNVLAWLEMLMAIAHQTGKSEEGRQLAYEWSIQSAKHVDDEFDKTWKSLEKLRGNRRPITAKYIVKWAKVFRKEDVREKLDEVLAEIELTSTIDDLKDAAAKACRIKGLQAIDRDLLATAIQREARRLGIKLPISSARKMIQYHGPKDAELPIWLENWVFLSHVNQFYNRSTGESVDGSAFDKMFGRYVGDDTTPTWVAARVSPVPVYHMTMYLPGDGDTFRDQDGLEWINTYRNVAPAVPETYSARDLRNIEIVKNHAVHLFGEHQRRDIEILHSTLAYIVQTGKRVNWLTLIQGAQGVGKTFYAELMGAVLGGKPHVFEIESDILINSSFTEWAEGHQFVYIEELMVHGKRFDVMDKLKPYITNNTISVHPKGKRQYNAINTTSYFAFTNHRNAIPVTEDDTRYFIMLSQWQQKEDIDRFKKENPKYYAHLMRALRQSPGALRKWLLEYERHPDFDPAARAPESIGKQEIIDEMKSELQMEIEDLIESGAPGVSEDLIVVHLLRDALTEGETVPVIKNTLRKMQFCPIKKNRVKISSKPHGVDQQDFYCWSRNPEILKLDQNEIRQIIIRKILPFLT